MKRVLIFVTPFSIYFLLFMIYIGAYASNEGDTDYIYLFGIPLLIWIGMAIYFYINNRKEFLTSLFSTTGFLLICFLLMWIF